VWTLPDLLAFPKAFMDAFNVGDYEGVSSILYRALTEDCALRTPALRCDVTGRATVAHMVLALLDDHPDAIMMWRDPV
jgi:hypothetical protein